MYDGDDIACVKRHATSVTTTSVAAFLGIAVYRFGATNTNSAVCDLTSVKVSPSMDHKLSGHPENGKPMTIVDPPGHNHIPDIARKVDTVRRYFYYRSE